MMNATNNNNNEGSTSSGSSSNNNSSTTTNVKTSTTNTIATTSNGGGNKDDEVAGEKTIVNLFVPGRNRGPFAQVILPEWNETFEHYDSKLRTDEKFRKFLNKPVEKRPLLVFLVNSATRGCEHRRKFNMLPLGIAKDVDDALVMIGRARQMKLIPEDAEASLLPLGIFSEVRDSARPDETTAIITPKTAVVASIDDQALEMEKWREGIEHAARIQKQERDAIQKRRQELFADKNSTDGNPELVERELENPDRVFQRVKTSNLPLPIQEYQRGVEMSEYAQLQSDGKLPTHIPSNMIEYLFYNTDS